MATVRAMDAYCASCLGSGVMSVAMVSPEPRVSTATTWLAPALPCISCLTLSVSDDLRSSSCFCQEAMSPALAVTTCLGSAPPLAGCWLVTVRSLGEQILLYWPLGPQGVLGHWVVVLAPTLPAASAVPSCAGMGLLVAVPVVGSGAPQCTRVPWVALNLICGVVEVSNSVPLGTVKSATFLRSVCSTSWALAGVAGRVLVPVGLAWNCWVSSAV